MKEKILPMLGSVRFWFCVAFAVAFYLGKQDILMDSVTSAVEIFTALGIGIRTLDGLVEKAKE